MTEARLVTAFERSLVENGWHGTTLVRVAELAKASRMTLHRHGVSKESLLEELSGRLDAEHRDALWPAVTDSAPGRERLERALEAEFALTEKHLALLEALDTAEHAALYHEDGPSGARSSYIAPYERILRDGAADGSLRALDDVTESATVLFTSVGLTYRHLRTGHGWSAKRCSSVLTRAVLAGLST